MRNAKARFVILSLGWLVSIAMASIMSPQAVLTQAVGGDAWARVTEDERAIKIETDKLEAVIPKKNPKQWMTGIEKGSFVDKTTGFREVGDGLMVVDWLMEAGSDAEWSDQVFAPDGNGVGRYSWYDERNRSGTAGLHAACPTAAAIASGWSRARSFAIA